MRRFIIQWHANPCRISTPTTICLATDNRHDATILFPVIPYFNDLTGVLWWWFCRFPMLFLLHLQILSVQRISWIACMAPGALTLFWVQTLWFFFGRVGYPIWVYGGCYCFWSRLGICGVMLDMNRCKYFAVRGGDVGWIEALEFGERLPAWRFAVDRKKPCDVQFWGPFEYCKLWRLYKHEGVRPERRVSHEN